MLILFSLLFTCVITFNLTDSELPLSLYLFLTWLEKSTLTFLFKLLLEGDFRLFTHKNRGRVISCISTNFVFVTLIIERFSKKKPKIGKMLLVVHYLQK